MNKKFCELVTEGYYYVKNNYVHRCYYLTGTLKGNKWIELQTSNPKWTGLLWNCINKEMLTDCKFYENNPTDIQI